MKPQEVIVNDQDSLKQNPWEKQSCLLSLHRHPAGVRYPGLGWMCPAWKGVFMHSSCSPSIRYLLGTDYMPGPVAGTEDTAKSPALWTYIIVQWQKSKAQKENVLCQMVPVIRAMHENGAVKGVRLFAILNREITKASSEGDIWAKIWRNQGSKLHSIWRSSILVEGTASANVLRWDHPWASQGSARRWESSRRNKHTKGTV